MFKSTVARIIRKLNYYHMLDALPDKMYLQLIYWERLGRRLHLNPPVTFNEKLQWLKLNDRKDIFTVMVDKKDAKAFVAERIGDEYIVKTLGVWDHYDDIDFSELPGRFVLKCSHDSGGLIICRDKSTLDHTKAKTKIEKSLSNNYYISGREWPYKNVKPCIIAEEYLEDSKGSTCLTDYKFYCFHGTPHYLYVSTGMEDHSTARISFLTLDWKFAPFGRADYKEFETLPEKPERLEDMIEIAKKLSAGTKFLRVDLYEINGKIYFSELTFFPCSGMMPFTNDKYDKLLGDMINL
ncbi:ATP-grasp fold amidoligase family protein [Enterococcus faecium]|uniref:ATP-grasp fold amidoligase family protein n=1 Tax=Enterococcus faecium TaxID=1352 RepID=UPI001E2E257C|nr:ATP-grasp fold amidoligase family protein [Enterococcus faecium]MDK4377291.1 glycosyl transferase [Enterococcus faecium]